MDHEKEGHRDLAQSAGPVAVDFFPNLYLPGHPDHGHLGHGQLGALVEEAVAVQRPEGVRVLGLAGPGLVGVAACLVVHICNSHTHNSNALLKY